MSGDILPLAVLVLAAGESSRMGSPKALLPLGDQNFLTHILSNSFLQQSHISPHVVLGHKPENVLSLIPKSVTSSINHHYAKGRTTSIQCGLSKVKDDVAGFFLIPVDCPLIEPEVYESVFNAFENQHSICIPSFQHKRGHPPLIGKAYFDEILALGEDESLRTLYTRYANKITHVRVESESIIHNINTPDDYKSVVSVYESKQGEM